MTHPTQRIDDTVHQRVRLGILALLSPVRSCDFVYLRDEMEATDGNLSRHLSVLEEAGYVKVEKGYVGRKPRTSVRITNQGRKALGDEVAALKQLIDHVDGAS